MISDHIARVCHAANRAYCITLNDFSQPSWDVAPDWQKESLVNGVEFHLANPEAGPEASHENWLEEKREAGWEYGKVKDVIAKTHPCFVPYNDLPEEQQLKDALFISIIKALIA